MIDNRVSEELELSKVLEYISKYVFTEIGKKYILSTGPFNEKKEAAFRGLLVSEAKDTLIKNDIPPISYIPDLSEVLSKSTIEGVVLNQKQIFDVLTLAGTSRKLYQFLKFEDTVPNLFGHYKESFFVDKVFEHNISALFDENGEIKDSASAKLREIRQDIKIKSENLRKTIQKILKQLSDAYLVQEEYTTQRDGRTVLPIKAEHKRHVRGFIHSESSSGQTVYIEPEETLELNNEILSLTFAEKREIDRILSNITKKIGSASVQLKHALRTISEIDAIFAKARYSIEIIGSFPTFNDDEPYEILNGRHPLLLKKIGRDKTVPLSLKIVDNNIVLITGPNAGGKTVVLKTVGLIALLAQCGIHIPVDPDTNMRFFDKILIDIGDQQSIEEDLSTFSSHLSNIKNIIQKADGNSLVLLDEIGTGTDPTEGSALAVAVLIYLQRLDSIVLATTHHGSLKVIAHDYEGFENASMEFDIERLEPSYKFQQGLPGSSYAFEVAERIGFDKDFIELSKKYIDKDKTKLEELLVDLENKARQYHSKLNTMEIENTRLSGLIKLYEAKIGELERQKSEIISDARIKAELYLQDVNKKIERAIKNIKESQAEKEVVKQEKKIIETLKKSVELPVREIRVTEDLPLKPGDFVKIKGTSTEGVITETDTDKKIAVIASGSIKLKAKFGSLILTERHEKSPSGSGISYIPEINSLKLDIRGNKPEEIEFEVLKFLDDAYSGGIQRIEILHGKGTGVLKNAVHRILKSHDHVKNYYFAKIEFGGEGITVVELA